MTLDRTFHSVGPSGGRPSGFATSPTALTPFPIRRRTCANCFLRPRTLVAALALYTLLFLLGYRHFTGSRPADRGVRPRGADDSPLATFLRHAQAAEAAGNQLGRGSRAIHAHAAGELLDLRHNALLAVVPRRVPSHLDAEDAARCVAAVIFVREDMFPVQLVHQLRSATAAPGGVAPQIRVVVLLHAAFPAEAVARLGEVYRPDEGVLIVVNAPNRSHFATAMNHAVAQHVPPACRALLFLSEFLAIDDVTGFIAALSSALVLRRGDGADGAAAAEVGVAGCRMAIRHDHDTDTGDASNRSHSPSSSSSRNGDDGSGANLVIADAGSDVALGAVGGAFRRAFIVRRHVGLTLSDPRVRAESASAAVDADVVSSLCLAVRQETFNMLAGFEAVDRVLARDSVERLGVATPAKSEATRIRELAVEVLSFRLQFLDRAISKIKIAEVSSASAEFRKTVMRAIATDTACIQLMEVESGGTWSTGAATPKLPADVAEAERARMKELLAQPRDAMLPAMRDHVEEAASVVREYGAARSGAAPEESVGWDISLRARRAGLRVVVVPALARLESRNALAALAMGAMHRSGALLPASYALTSGMREKWELTAVAMHRSSRSAPSARVVVIWNAYCCMCCGFVNEIVSLVTHLQRLREVVIIPEADCFCPLSLGAEEMVRRLHILPRKLHRASVDDVMVWISHTDPSMYAGVNVIGVGRVDYFVGRSMYEFSRIAPDMVKAANTKADEVWVPADFVRRVYVDSGVAPERLVVIPEAVDTNLFQPGASQVQRVSLDSPELNGWQHWCNRRPHPRGFRFFSDFKWEPRKGWDVLFHAFLRAFPLATAANDGDSAAPPTLFVLSHIWFAGAPETHGWKHNISSMRDDVDAFIRATFGAAAPEADETGRPTYCFISEALSPQALAGLYDAVDAFVLPTRGEGWGLPAIQAMATGKPTISTNWGGNTEFMKRHNSFLIPLDAVEEVPRDSVYGWELGKKWATPSVSALASIMKYVVANPEHAARVGRRGRNYVASRFSEEAVARRIDERLAQIRVRVMGARRKHERRPDDTHAKVKAP